LNGLLAYTDKDKENKLKEFDKLIKFIVPSKLNSEDLKTFAKKYKWLKSLTEWKKVVVLSQDEGGDENVGDEEEEEADEDEEEEKEEEEEEEEEEEDDESSSKICKFAQKLGTSSFLYNKKKDECIFTGSGWTGTSVGEKTSKYGIKILVVATSLMMGFCNPKLLNKNGNNNEVCGYYLFLNGTGVLYSQQGEKGKAYTTGCDANAGSCYSAFYNSKKRTISFSRADNPLGLAFQIQDKKVKGLHPSFDFYQGNSSIKFVKPAKEKKKK